MTTTPPDGNDQLNPTHGHTHEDTSSAHPTSTGIPTAVNLGRVVEGIEDLWAPRVVAQVNDYAVKVARIQGEFVWHTHEDTDELFVVLSGQLDLHQREADEEQVVSLGPQDVHVVPRGVLHKPVSATGAVIMMVEPSATLSTGDYTGDIPSHITSTRGLLLG